MKKLLLTLTITIIAAGLIAQSRVMVPTHLRNKSFQNEPAKKFANDPENMLAPFNTMKPEFVTEDPIGDTRYDNQSNASIPKKIVLFGDGTIGATWTRSMQEGSFFADRGTGYNYFDGSNWDEWPISRIENIKVHRPVYAAWGENGEMVVTHLSGTGLYFSTRPDKGTGSWNYSTFSGPAGGEYLVWARLVTSGIDHNRVHILALTLPGSHGGSPYAGLDGALLYSMSNDGGSTWELQHVILDGMSSDDYTGFAGDTYAFAEPKGDIVAFVVGDPWTGLFLMKSTDGGLNFEKTIIWEHPYPGWTFGTQTDTFYCADGAQSAVIDNSGMVHVAFGINRAAADATTTYWYPWVDGIAYWNENMPAFSDNLNALNPNNHPESELIEDYNLIGWTQDVNNNGELDLLDEIGLYWIGLSSMPQLVYDENNNQLHLVYSSVTETYSNGQQNYRHLWYRMSDPAGESWGGFEHLTSDIAHLFDECVYPACASGTNDQLHLIYQYDNMPGTAVWGAQHDYTDNIIGYLSKPLPLGTSIKELEVASLSVSQLYPNPVHDRAYLQLNLRTQTKVDIIVTDLSGKQIISLPGKLTNSGTHLLEIDASGLSGGIYFYRIHAQGQAVIGKMVVE